MGVLIGIDSQAKRVGCLDSMNIKNEMFETFNSIQRYVLIMR